MAIVCGTGGWSGPKPGDPDNNSILTATPAFGGIDVSWSYPAVNPFAVAHTILYRSLIDDFSIATRRAVVDGNWFYDRIETNLTAQYFYWIVFVSVNGTYGDPIGPAVAIPRGMISEVITELTGKIDAGVLAQSLKVDIDKIAILSGDMISEIQARIAADDALGLTLTQVQDDMSSALILVQDEITQRISADDAHVEQVNLLLAQVNDDIGAAVLVESEARAAADGVLAGQITTAQSVLGADIASVQTTLQTNIDTMGDTVTAIGALYTAKVSVNGLVGGFGVYNDGTEVEAGFDVDTFWVGRTGATLRKPFIVSGTEVFIDNAVINQLTADKIDTRGLSIKDLDGNVIFAAGTSLDWSRIGGGAKPQDYATVGADESNLQVGVAGNLLPNSQFASGLYSPWWPGWNPDNSVIDLFDTVNSAFGVDSQWSLQGHECIVIRQVGTTGTNTNDPTMNVAPPLAEAPPAQLLDGTWPLDGSHTLNG